jgi:hypothetical protein
MSIAIAEVIVSQAPWTPQVLADSFVTCFKRDRTEDYAGGFYDGNPSNAGLQLLSATRYANAKSKID